MNGFDTDKCLKVKENVNLLPPITVIPPQLHPPIAKLDSGATGSYFQMQDAKHLQNIQNQTGPIVVLPDNSKMTSTKTGSLPFPGLSSKAQQAHIYPKLQSASLISVGKLCDDGCDVTFRKNDVTAVKNNNIVLSGKRN